MLRSALILAPSAVAATAQADCVKSSPAGEWVDCTTGKPASAPTPRKPADAAKANLCLQGVRAAYEAYSMAVYDAKNPPVEGLARALDFRFSQQPFPASEEHAVESLGYIAKKLRDAGIRAPQDWQVTAAAEEYIRKECSR